MRSIPIFLFYVPFSSYIKLYIVTYIYTVYKRVMQCIYTCPNILRLHPIFFYRAIKRNYTYIATMTQGNITPALFLFISYLALRLFLNNLKWYVSLNPILLCHINCYMHTFYDFTPLIIAQFPCSILHIYEMLLRNKRYA